MDETIIIGISGASGSGKSLLSKTIVDELCSEHLAVISEDAYYKDLSHMTMAEREKVNFDHPDALDHDLLKEHLLALKQGQGISVPIYDYATHNRTDKTKRIENANRIVILEGILLFVDPKLRDLMDIKIFVDTPLDVCFIRRLERDVIERARSMDSVITQYQKTVRKMFVQFIEPSKRYADLIVPHGGKNRIAIDLIQARMKAMLSGV